MECIKCCSDCGVGFTATNNCHRYCPTCGKERDKISKEKWQKNNHIKVLGYTEHWRDKNPETVKTSRKKTYEKYREKYILEGTIYNQVNPQAPYEVSRGGIGEGVK